MNGLRRMQHRPRPWRCNTNPGAIFCTLHGDCSCDPSQLLPSALCPLHGTATDHPSEPRLVGVS